VVFITFVALWIVVRHTDNIRRYIATDTLEHKKRPTDL
jgi:hypothetical protein